MNIRKAVKTIHEQIMQKRSELEELRFQLLVIQSRCSHPADKRVIVTDQSDLYDVTSCDECGKVFEK